MSWKREREGLIAQTLAFVQSVTGKGGERTASQTIPPLPSETEISAKPSVGAAALLAVETALGAGPSSAVQSATPTARPQRFDPQRFELQRFEAPRVEAPRVEAPRVEAPRVEPPEVERPSPPAPAPILQRPIPQSEMASEIRARIASFRAHQERFNREREEYFAATLARLRASLGDAAPPPRLRK
jgi:hypothetical protein